MVRKKSPPAGGQAQTMEELLTKTHNIPHGLKKGQEIEGSITALSPKGIYLDINAKTEAVVLEKDKRILAELLSTLRVGQRVKATVLNPESEEGYAVFSLRRQRKDKGWEELAKALSDKLPLEARVVELGRSGVLLDYAGIRGFLPLSHLVNPIDESFVGKNIPVKALEVDRSSNRLLFSQKVREDVSEKLAQMKVGQVVSGTVSGITNFGIFVSLGNGVEGLVHISEVSWDTPADLEKKFAIGEKVEVLVIDIDRQNQKLSLSLKKLSPDPWVLAASKLSADQEVEGRVCRITSFGVFVELVGEHAGLEALIKRRHVPIGKVFHVDDSLTCTIESIDSEKRRLYIMPVLKEKPIGYR